MKYMVIIYGNKDLWQSFPSEVAAKAIAEVDAFNKRHSEAGELYVFSLSRHSSASAGLLFARGGLAAGGR